MKQSKYNNINHVSLNDIIKAEAISTRPSTVVKTSDLNFILEDERDGERGRPKKHYMITETKAVNLCIEKRWDKAFDILFTLNMETPESPEAVIPPCGKNAKIALLGDNLDNLQQRHQTLIEVAQERVEALRWRVAFFIATSLFAVAYIIIKAILE